MVTEMFSSVWSCHLQGSNWHLCLNGMTNLMDFLIIAFSWLTPGEGDNRQQEAPQHWLYLPRREWEARGMTRPQKGQCSDNISFLHVVHDGTANCRSSLFSELLWLNVGSISSGMNLGLAGSSEAMNRDMLPSDSGSYCYSHEALQPTYR